MKGILSYSGSYAQFAQKGNEKHKCECLIQPNCNNKIKGQAPRSNLASFRPLVVTDLQS